MNQIKDLIFLKSRIKFCFINRLHSVSHATQNDNEGLKKEKEAALSPKDDSGDT